MKKPEKTKLKLARETIRTLDDRALRDAAGGGVYTSYTTVSTKTTSGTSYEGP